LKKLVILMAAIVFTACSSKPKEEMATTTSDVEKKVMEATETTQASAAEEMKEAKKTSKKMKEEATTTQAPATPSATSDFPSISGTEKSSVTCTNKNDSRKISVLSVTEGGCGVVYNKMGEDKTVAVAKADMNYCDSVSTKIKSNLEGAGFNCGGGAAATGTSSDSNTGNQ
jgi:hypothetical protein